MTTDYKLFALDVDGTLLERDGTLAPSTKEFIAHLSKASRVTLATGRSLASAQPYLSELSITTPAILYHGAVVFDPVEGRPLREVHIPGELACRAFEVSKRFPVHPQLYRSVDDPTVYVPRLTPPIKEFVRKESLKSELVPNFEKFLTQPPLKLLFIGDPEILPGFEEQCRKNFPNLPSSAPRGTTSKSYHREFPREKGSPGCASISNPSFPHRRGRGPGKRYPNDRTGRPRGGDGGRGEEVNRTRRSCHRKHPTDVGDLVKRLAFIMLGMIKEKT